MTIHVVSDKLSVYDILLGLDFLRDVQYKIKGDSIYIKTKEDIAEEQVLEDLKIDVQSNEVHL